MTPFHFGHSDAPLFGVYHERARHVPRAPAVLICNPFGEEAIRAFRNLKRLAEALSQRGMSVLRFDYFGTGDSAGDDDQVCLTRMMDDIQTAHQELADMAATQRIIWVGLRLGASAALLASSGVGPCPSGLLLWEPVVNGLEELAALQRAHAVTTEAALGEPEVTQSASLGFALPDRFRAELSMLDLLSVRYRPASLTGIVPAIDPPTDPRLKVAIDATGGSSLWLDPPHDPAWNTDNAMNAFTVPARTIDLIAATLADWP